MPMYWNFNCFLGCIYTVYYIVYIIFLVLNWLSNLEFWLLKKEDQVARIGVRGGGLGDSGNGRRKTFFPVDVFPWTFSFQVQHLMKEERGTNDNYEVKPKREKISIRRWWWCWANPRENLPIRRDRSKLRAKDWVWAPWQEFGTKYLTCVLIRVAEVVRVQGGPRRKV